MSDHWLRFHRGPLSARLDKTTMRPVMMASREVMRSLEWWLQAEVDVLIACVDPTSSAAKIRRLQGVRRRYVKINSAAAVKLGSALTNHLRGHCGRNDPETIKDEFVRMNRDVCEHCRNERAAAISESRREVSSSTRSRKAIERSNQTDGNYTPLISTSPRQPSHSIRRRTTRRVS